MAKWLASPALEPNVRVLSSQLAVEVLAPRAALIVQARPESVEKMGLTSLRDTPFPSQPNTVSGSDPLIWWMNPVAWLVTATSIDASSLSKDLTAVSSEIPLSMVDISDSFATFQARGARARDLLARGTGLNLDPAQFRPGQCARTRLANLSALIRPLSDQSLEIWIDRSVAHHFYDWLLDAAVGVRDRID